MKKTLMNFRIFSYVLLLLFGLSSGVLARDNILLYTPFTGIAESPGESISYTITVINNTDITQNMVFSMEGLPENWGYNIRSLGKEIRKLAIKSADFDDNQRNIDLEIEIPLEVQEGDYEFKFVARTDKGIRAELPLTVTIKEKGVFKTEFTIGQANMEGYSDSSFNYTAEIRNRTAEKQHYALIATAPRGWDVRFRVDGDYVTSLSLDTNERKRIDIYVKPPVNISADTYNLKVRAVSGQTSEEIDLEAVIKGKYGLNLTTVTGLLSADIPVGGEKEIQLFIENTGTVPLHDIALSSSTPLDWSVDFEKKEIAKLDAGENTTVKAVIKTSKKAIAGDYQLNITARTPEVSSTKSFRITVKTSMLWGAVGVLIILIVLCVLYYFVRKYGRR